MGADILERLQHTAAMHGWTGNAPENSVAGMLNEAAAEIVRLRGEVAAPLEDPDEAELVYRCGDPDSDAIAPADAKGCNCGGCEVCDATDLLPQPAGGEAVARVIRKGNSRGGLQWTDAGCDADLPDGALLYTTPPAAQVHLSDEVEEVIVRRAFADIEADVYEDERALTMKRAAELLATHPAAEAAQVQWISAGDAVFAFSALLTSLPHVVPFGSAAWATPGAKLAAAFNEANGLAVSCDFPSGLRYPKIEGELLEVIQEAAKPEATHPAAGDKVREDGVGLIAAERQRQITAEGWTPEHDDEHDDHQLSQAAACYALGVPAAVNDTGSRVWLWPWELEWWKPTDRMRDLAKAGALIAAEIDRLQRAALAQPQSGGDA